MRIAGIFPNVYPGRPGRRRKPVPDRSGNLFFFLASVFLVAVPLPERLAAGYLEERSSRLFFRISHTQNGAFARGPSIVPKTAIKAR